MRAQVVAMAFLTAVAAAQTQIVPAAFGDPNVPARTTRVPFGLAMAARVQTYYHASETGIGGAAALRSIEIRAYPPNAAKTAIDMQITISATSATMQNLGNTFAANHGANATVVYVRKLTNLAAVTAPNPLAFGGVWMFDTPFVYVPAQGNLLVDYDIASQPALPWMALEAFEIGGAPHTQSGLGCRGLTTFSRGDMLGEVLEFGVHGGVPNGAATLMFGALLPAPIPFPGAPGCELHVNPTLGWNAPLDALGHASLRFPIPEAAGLRGWTLSAQFVTTHAAGLAFSAARTAPLRGYAATSIVHETSNLAPTGVAERATLVIRLGT